MFIVYEVTNLVLLYFPSGGKYMLHFEANGPLKVQARHLAPCLTGDDDGISGLLKVTDVLEVWPILYGL